MALLGYSYFVDLLKYFNLSLPLICY